MVADLLERLWMLPDLRFPGALSRRNRRSEPLLALRLCCVCGAVLVGSLWAVWNGFSEAGHSVAVEQEPQAHQVR